MGILRLVEFGLDIVNYDFSKRNLSLRPFYPRGERGDLALRQRHSDVPRRHRVQFRADPAAG